MSPGGGSWRPGFLALVIALLPAVTAVWVYPGFVTQDGPAHLYNAEVLARSFDPASPYGKAFAVRWDPLPNWAGHVGHMALVSTLPPRVADRVMTTATLVAFAGSLTWLRWRVAGPRGLPAAAVLSAVLGLNVTWLFGFTSFLLGAALFPLTLGVWWSGRDAGFSGRRAGALAALTTLGYFCHLVSLGLTAFALAVLEMLTPGRRRRGRAGATALGLLPLVPLGALYLGLSRRGGGGLAPEWGHLASGVGWPSALIRQLSWADPVSLARKDLLPLSGGDFSRWCVGLSPALWLWGGVALAAVATWRREGLAGERRGWWVVAGLLVLGGFAGPDTLGATHGHYLPQRVVLLGLAALVPVLDQGRAGAAMVAAALAVQSAVVWDYAGTSERTAGRIWGARGAVGIGQNVAALWENIRTPFRANPILHADCLLGVGAGNVIWGDYETRFYYFPVRFRAGLNGPDPAEIEAIALHDDPRDAAARARRWDALLRRHLEAIDVVVVWRGGEPDPSLDAVNARWFVTTYEDGPVRVLRRKRAGR